MESDKGRILAVISHLWGFGLLISWIVNLNVKNNFVSFYNRQMLGWHILAFLNGWLIYAILGGFIKWILGGALLIFWVMSIIGAFTKTETLIPFFGSYFQKIFRSL